MLAAPLVLAEKVAFTNAAVMLLALPVSWMPERVPSTSVRLPMLPLLLTSVSVKALLSMSATVKSTRALLTPVFTAVEPLGTPLIVGASFSAATSTRTAIGVEDSALLLSRAVTVKAAMALAPVPLALASGVQ